MHKSAVAIGIADRAPGVAKGALWLWARTLGWFGQKPEAVNHWLVSTLVDKLQYRLPIYTRLGNGMRIKVHAHDYVGGQIIKQGYYEPEIVRWFEQILKPGNVFIDVGTHVGQYTLVASRLIGSKGNVHGFEPDPETFRRLTSNIRRNRLRNVAANKLALADKPGTLHFFLSNVRDIGSNSLQKPPTFSGREVDVTCIALDDYLGTHGVQRVDLLKMDIEGAEYSALVGAKGLLTRDDRPPIIIEFEEERQVAFGYSCARLAELLTGFGYRLFRIGSEVVEEYVPRNPDAYSFNILAVPSNRRDLLDDMHKPAAAASPPA